MVAYFSFTFTFAYFQTLPAIGWVTAFEFTLYSMLLYSMSSGMLMLGMLQYRANYMLRQRENLVNEARIANQRAELERVQRLERERLIAMLGHELKTPIATLHMMLGDNKLPQEAVLQLREPLREINEVVERTVQTGQLESGAIGLRPEPCPLGSVLQQPVAQLPDLDRVQWTLHPPTEQLQVQADPFLLGVVVRNLFDNAIKYSPETTPIKSDVFYDPKQGRWRLEVRNLVGRAGFPDPAHLFEKFWRSPRASYRSGSGQGLFIAWRLSQLMGGSLRYNPGPDSVGFILELPISPPDPTVAPK